MNFPLTSQFWKFSKKIVVLDKRNGEKRKRGKRTELGKRVGADDLLPEDEENEKPTSSKWKARKKRKVSRKVNDGMMTETVEFCVTFVKQSCICNFWILL